MTTAVATADQTTREALRLLAFRASLFALIGAIAQVLALVLLVPAFVGTPRLAMAALMATGPLLAASLPVVSVLRPLASISIFVSAIATTGVVVAFMPGSGADVMTSRELSVPLAELAFWPVMAYCLAAGRALDDLARRAAVAASHKRPARAGAMLAGQARLRSAGALLLYALAATFAILSLLFLAALTLRLTNALDWLIATPVHVAILVLFSAICILLAESWLEHVRSEPRLAHVEPVLSRTFALRAAAQRRLLRTLIGLLPVLGFLGTVLGIMQALASLPVEFAAPSDARDADLTASLRGIATAFETTLLGLVGSVAATLVLASIERAEAIERADASGHDPEGPA